MNNQSFAKYAYHNLPIPFATIEGPSQRFIFVNPEFEKAFPKRKLLHIPIFDAIPELKDHLFHRLVKQCLETQEIVKSNNLPVMLDSSENDQRWVKYFNIILLPYRDDHNPQMTKAILLYMHDAVSKVIVSRMMGRTIFLSPTLN